jgi:hypothetical protein
MTTESLLTTEAANSTQGQAASQEAATTAPTGDAGTAQQQQATQGQDSSAPQGDTSSSTEGDKGEAGKATAPDKYEFSAPEGVTYDDTVIAQFSEVAKELNLPQDAAQKVLDKVAPVIRARQAEAIEAARTEWAEAAKVDKEFGGEKLDENLGLAKKALDKFGSPELRTLLNESGLGNHPEVIRLMVRAGKAISEDSFVAGGSTPGQAPDSLAQRMYPNMNP